jgi:hypothetical protein
MRARSVKSAVQHDGSSTLKEWSQEVEDTLAPSLNNVDNEDNEDNEDIKVLAPGATTSLTS